MCIYIHIYTYNLYIYVCRCKYIFIYTYILQVVIYMLHCFVNSFFLQNTTYLPVLLPMPVNCQGTAPTNLC